MAIIFTGLTFKLFFKTKFIISHLGIIITHIGAFLLLLGGIITGYFSFEGNMVIDENETISFIRDYHEVELAITVLGLKTQDKVIVIDQQTLAHKSKLSLKELPFEIEVLDFCKNCKVTRRTNQSTEHNGFAKIFSLDSIPLAKNDPENQSGIQIQIKNSEKDGKYAVFLDMPVKQSLVTHNRKYFFQIRKKRTPLPFKIELLNFTKLDYASTSMAKSYQSEVNLIDGKIKQRTVIKMNEPLRYKGYTLYQSSFIQDGNKETTVLSVVHNVGRLFPYISSIIMCIGLIIHLLLTSGLIKKPTRKAEEC